VCPRTFCSPYELALPGQASEVLRCLGLLGKLDQVADLRDQRFSDLVRACLSADARGVKAQVVVFGWLG
jgi:hypothetical protein